MRTVIAILLIIGRLLSPLMAQTRIPDVKSGNKELGYDENDVAYYLSCVSTFKDMGPKEVPDKLIEDRCGCKTEALQNNRYYEYALEKLQGRQITINYFLLERLAVVDATEAEVDRAMAKMRMGDLEKVAVLAIRQANGECSLRR
jgi:hypothetical protein